jgi:hypothetical protein
VVVSGDCTLFSLGDACESAASFRSLVLCRLLVSWVGRSRVVQLVFEPYWVLACLCSGVFRRCIRLACQTSLLVWCSGACMVLRAAVSLLRGAQLLLLF